MEILMRSSHLEESRMTLRLDPPKELNLSSRKILTTTLQTDSCPDTTETLLISSKDPRTTRDPTEEASNQEEAINQEEATNQEETTTQKTLLSK